MRAAKKRTVSPLVVGVGINALDTIIRVPFFPAPDSKVEIVSVEPMPGGQVASVMVTCRRWGLRARYVGKVGDDAAGARQIAEMKREQVDAQWIVAHGCKSQFSFILVNQSSGDRTILWNRDPRIALRAADLKRLWIRGARAALVDGHDTLAALRTARWAPQDGIPVVGDFDNRYPHVEALLEYADYPIMSKNFPERLTGEGDLLKSLPQIHSRFNCRLAASTLGASGVLAWNGYQFLYCPAFQLKAIDTTGASDIFHGAFVYGLVRGWSIDRILEFSSAAAALSCECPGARGGIASLRKIDALLRNGVRSAHAYSATQLREGSRAARAAEGYMA